MSHNKLKYVFIVFFFCILLGCKSNDNTETVPLPEAWPRIPVSVSDNMIEVSGTPIDILINPVATYETVKGNPSGLTVFYPSVSAQIYYTFIKPNNDEYDRVIEARKERINLNLNGSPAKVYYLENGSGMIVVSETINQTPVQMLVEKTPYIVSATAFINTPETQVEYDSIAPLIEVLQHDMAHSLPGLQFKN